MTKLLIIDGLNIVRRCYEANPAEDSEEKAQAAIKSALQSMSRGCREHGPSHCIVVFDAAGPNWRHKVYPQYKANRKPMSSFLAAELVNLKQNMLEQGMAWISLPGEEADDTICAIAKAALETKAQVVVLSSDKDLVRLAAAGAKVYSHFDKQWRDESWCLAKFGVSSRQLTDYLALMGDASDGIPGVAGIGAKTAAKLLAQFKTLDQVVVAAYSGEIPGKTGERLKEPTVELSKRLVEFRSNFTANQLDWAHWTAPV